MGNVDITANITYIITIERLTENKFAVKQINGKEQLVTLDIGDVLTVSVPIYMHEVINEL